VPVLLAAPAAGGRLLLARALHALAGRGGPLVAATGRRPPLGDLPAGGSLYLDVAALAPEAALVLEAVLDDGAVWVLAGIEPDAAPPANLASRLGAVVLAVPPLRARMDELPALAAAALAALARRRGGPPPRLTPAALARLGAHAWPGDLGELEAVLARAMLTAGGDVLDVEHLALGPGPPPPAVPARVAEAAAAPDAALEFLLAELAHELKNPMVTIKTYAEHLPDLLQDAELRARFAALAGEAIGRMDALLDNVLAFARLGAPRPQPIDTGAVLDRVLAEVEPELAGRTVRVRHATPPARCAADPEQLAYALRNLLAGVGREVPAGEELVVDAGANGVVTLRFATAGAAAGVALDRLRRLAAANDTARLTDPTLLPLAFRLARAVLERNGGALAVVPEAGDATALVVRLPTAPGEAR